MFKALTQALVGSQRLKERREKLAELSEVQESEAFHGVCVTCHRCPRQGLVPANGIARRKISVNPCAIESPLPAQQALTRGKAVTSHAHSTGLSPSSLFVGGD